MGDVSCCLLLLLRRQLVGQRVEGGRQGSWQSAVVVRVRWLAAAAAPQGVVVSVCSSGCDGKGVGFFGGMGEWGARG